MSTDHNLQDIETVYRRDARRVFATLMRLLGDFDLAEEALHEAFRAALEQWPRIELKKRSSEVKVKQAWEIMRFGIGEAGITIKSCHS